MASMTRRPVFRFIGLLRGYKTQTAGAIALGTATVLAGMGLMAGSGYLISRAALQPLIVDLFLVIAAVRLFGISRAALRYLERLISHDLTFRLLMQIRVWFYRRLEPLSSAQLLGFRSGDISARIVDDVDMLQNIYLRVVAPSVVALFVVAVTFAGLYYFEPALAYTALLFLFLNGFAVPVLVRRISRSYGKLQVETRAGLKEFLVDCLQGLSDMLSFGLERKFSDSIRSYNKTLSAIQRKQASVSGLQQSLSGLCMYFGIAAILLLSIPAIVDGQIEGVYLALIIFGVMSSFEAVQNLGPAVQHLEASDEAGRRLFNIIDTAPGIRDPQKPAPVSTNGDVVFDGVGFAYEEIRLLSEISFTLRKGNRTAIVGPTGAGKSTVVNLLLRLWDPQSGSIAFDGTDIRDLDVGEYRSKFTVISQDTHLFNGSVRDNLLIARDHADDRELLSALEEARLRNLIEGLPDGLETLIGEHGMRLSAGERQRLALARAFLRKSPILVLDEPTANLDAVTERELFYNLERCMAGRTTLLITHRPILLESMDEIIVMKGGFIVERGSLEHLSGHQGLYHDLFLRRNHLLD